MNKETQEAMLQDIADFWRQKGKLVVETNTAPLLSMTDVPIKRMSREDLETAYKELGVQYRSLHAKMTVVTESVWIASKISEAFAKEYAVKIVQALDNPESWWKDKDKTQIQHVIDVVMGVKPKRSVV